MDPRRPELAVSRMRELMEQFDDVMSKIKVAEVYNRLGGLEREGSLVIQEICLVAPRLHEAMMQASRTRRFTLSHQPAEPVENYVSPNQAETVIVEPKPRKKKTSRKKAE